MKIIRRLYLVFFVAMLLAACKPAPVNRQPIALGNLPDGLYVGHAKHMNSADVEVVVVDRRIEEVRVLKFDATFHGQPARDSIPGRIVRAQSPYVDAVSGATEASHTLINAVVDALKEGRAGH